jgi:trehalose 2-sulfotransferase
MSITRVGIMTEERPIRTMTDERLDFAHRTPMRKSYIVASSPRSGSTYLCRLLGQSGLLGTPSEVLNPGFDLRGFKNRFKVSSPADYIAELIARRTAKSGVFGLKAHFENFEGFLKEYPELLDVLSPVTYIYINRRDRVAQAVSMARALQTNQWSSQGEKGPKPQLRYDRELIANSMKEVELQDAGWLNWFKANKITPFRLTYEDLLDDPAGTVRSVVEHLEVQNAERDEVKVPPVEKQSDDTNQEWIERFRRETEGDGSGGELGVPPPDASSTRRGAPDHFFEREARLIQALPKMRDSATGFLDLIRLRHRYNAIIWQNRELLRGARVLDLISYAGFWGLAALDAGAASVTVVETTPKNLDAARKNFSQSQFEAKRYQLLKSKITEALKKMEPKQFDVVLCKKYFEHCYLPDFFSELCRLQPKYVIVDTKVAFGEGALCRFSIAGKAWKGARSGRIVSTPSHEAIVLLCGSEFHWRVVDWKAMDIADWTGIPDYADGSHRTYVLERE